jgi:hypothetical protein
MGIALPFIIDNTEDAQICDMEVILVPPIKGSEMMYEKSAEKYATFVRYF